MDVSSVGAQQFHAPAHLQGLELGQNRNVPATNDHDADDLGKSEAVNDHDADDFGNTPGVSRLASPRLQAVNAASQSEETSEKASEEQAEQLQLFDRQGQLEEPQHGAKVVDLFA